VGCKTCFVGSKDFFDSPFLARWLLDFLFLWLDFLVRGQQV
jgi:hypothetical protein